MEQHLESAQNDSEQKLHQELNIPIGMIHSSWSGSPAESWATVDYLEKIKPKKFMRICAASI